MKKNNKKIIFLLVIFSLLIIIQLSNYIYAQSSYGEEIKKESYEISRDKITRTIKEGDLFNDEIIIKNLRPNDITISYSASESIKNQVTFESIGQIIGPGNSSQIPLLIIGDKVGFYSGEVKISGDINEILPVNITVVNQSLSSRLLLTLQTITKKVSLKGQPSIKIKIEEIGPRFTQNLTINYLLINTLDNKSQELYSETFIITGTIQQIKKFSLPENISEGIYLIQSQADFENSTIISKDTFEVKKNIWEIKIFGTIPAWIAVLAFFLILIGIIIYMFIRKILENRKKYRMQLDLKSLPVKGERTMWLGKIAETNVDAFLNLDNLTTHGVVAGATGGGKSIAAQVLIEEALLKGISVIVFDPTAQWSGMLRKCDDKKMMSFYPRFGLKSSDAKAFPGNVRMIRHARQKINIKKYMNPGQIQIFSLNKLDPSQMDLFVSSVISSIFRSDPQEFPGLRTLLVFDEVHRLLPKFGGSGKGFLQIERACREFRKWGFGVMLVSQVLSDFVGEIKANINTEVQMRTRDEADLNRLKTKYGEEFLQSLIKASVGVGMFVNPNHNRGRPYFIQFRPILHNTRRLTDDILEKYNQYGELIEDYEYQILQLDENKTDTFDLKMELKLVKDKLMTGNFTVVDIYLEGLKPRFEKLWEKLGKKPKKLEIELVEEKDIESSLKQAAKERTDIQNKEKQEQSTEKKQEKIDISKKLVKSLTFDNGIMVSSLGELHDSLPSIDNQTLALHINDEKNDVANWLFENFDKNLAQKVKPLRDKKSIIAQIEEFIKESNKDEKKDVKEEKKEDKEEKKEDKDNKKEEKT